MTIESGAEPTGKRIARLVAFCARHPRALILAGALAAVAGIFARRSLARDVIPDLSDPQVVLVADWMGHPAVEVASRVTEVVTAALTGVPGSTAVRGTSMTGMAYVDVVFDSVSALSGGRAEIARRVAALRPRLPEAVRVEVGPAASATGWVFQYALIPTKPQVMPMLEAQQMGAGGPLRPLREFQDQVLRPALAAVPGVAEVASLGGQPDEVLVETSAEQLHAVGAAVSDVHAAVSSALAAHPNATVEDLTRAVQSDPVLGKVTGVRVAPAMPVGLADVDGLQQIVVGTVIARRDADPGAVIAGVKQVIDHERHELPTGTKLGVLYDRSELTGRVEHTLLRALGEEIGMVVLVILIFLFHARSALVPMATLPLVVLLTFAGMRLFGVPATVMSLGGIAIALGMAVDAELVALEACHRRLEPRPGAPFGPAERRRRIIDAAAAFAPAILTSLLIAAMAFLPVFAFGGETGRLLRPLAMTKTLVVLAGALVTLTVAPALRDRLLGGGRVVPEARNPLTSALVRIYRPFVHFALERPGLTLATAALAALSCLPVIPRLGSEFLPRIDEGELLYMPTTAPGLSGDDAAGELLEQDRDIAAHPAVANAYGKIGRSETGTDPAPFSMAETTVRLKPRAEWPKVAHRRWYSGWAPAPLRRLLGLVWPEQTTMTTAELIDSLDSHTRRVGWTNAWTGPVRARIDMMATGVSTPVGVRIVARDPSRLGALGRTVADAVRVVPGTRSAIYEDQGGETRLGFALDTAALARYGVDPERARAVADLMLAGGGVGQVQSLHDDPPSSVVMPVRIALGAEWLPKVPLADLVRAATVRAGRRGEGQPVPLGLLGRAKFELVPAALHAEAGELCGYVYVDLDEATDAGADLDGYVARARAAADRAVSLLPGERLEWTGQYQMLSSGRHRLELIAPLVALAMLVLLYFQFRNLTEALIVLVSVPFALVGSFWTLYLLDYKLSAPVWVGLLSVVGLAMQTGVLMVIYIDDAFHRRMREGTLRTREDLVDAHAEGTVRRLRPKIMTITTMIAGLLPLLWAEGSGAEIMKRVAAPMIGGLCTSAFLTLEVIPVLYTIWRTRQLGLQPAGARRFEPVQPLVLPIDGEAAPTRASASSTVNVRS
jgi:Cu(I)/Ag(I) efflux system membrane protein CusA/SilA